MIFDKNGYITREEGEPLFRSCWECNSAHDHLKKVNTLHVCFSCGRYWVFDRFLKSFYENVSLENGNKALVEWFNKKGIAPGESTTKVDAGYRLMKMEISFKRGVKLLKKTRKEERK